MPDASDYIAQKKSDALVGSELFSNKNKVSTQAYQLALLKRVTGPQGYSNVGGGGSDVGAYLYQECTDCKEPGQLPTGFLFSDGSFAYTSSGGDSAVYLSSQIFKIIANGTPSNTGRTIYYNSLTSGVTYTVTISSYIYTLPPGRFFTNR